MVCCLDMHWCECLVCKTINQETESTRIHLMLQTFWARKVINTMILMIQTKPLWFWLAQHLTFFHCIKFCFDHFKTAIINWIWFIKCHNSFSFFGFHGFLFSLIIRMISFSRHLYHQMNESHFTFSSLFLFKVFFLVFVFLVSYQIFGSSSKQGIWFELTWIVSHCWRQKENSLLPSRSMHE